MSGFAEWSRRAANSPTIWPKLDRPAATMSILLAPMRLTRYPVEIDVGEPEADIDIHHAVIRHPEPFENDHLTVECRRFIQPRPALRSITIIASAGSCGPTGR